LPRKVRGAAVAAEAPALASVPAVVALVECQEVGARELADLVPVAGRAQRVNQEAFGKVAVVPAPEEVWEPVVPQVVEQGVVLAADRVRAPEVPEADPEGAVRVEEPAVAVAAVAVAAVGLGLASAAVAAGRVLAEEALAPVAELAAGKPLEGG
jgi:hypothetical protein